MKKYFYIFFSLVSVLFSYGQNDRHIINKIDSLNTLGVSFLDNGDIKKSIEFLNLATKLSDSIEDNYGKAIANITLGKIYYKLNENKDAETRFLKSLSASERIKDDYLIAQSYLYLGDVYAIGFKQKQKGIEEYKSALTYVNNIGLYGQYTLNDRETVKSNALINLSASYLDINEFNSAINYILEAKKSADLIADDPLKLSNIEFLLGRYYEQKDVHYNAISKYVEAINIIKNSSINSNEANLALSKIYKEYANSLKKIDKIDEAYLALLTHNNYREKVINEEQVKQSKLAKTKFDIADYKNSIATANKEKELQEHLANKARNINIVVIAAIFVLLISLLTLYKNFKSKQSLSALLEARNKQLEIAKNEAVKSSQLKTNFISNVSHELRTPLYGVVGLTSILLKNNDLSERDNKFLKSLKFSGDYLLNLINDVLQIGKMESKKIELHNSSINLKRILGNITDSFEYQLESNANKLHLYIDNEVPSHVFGDNIRLSQILINLIGNGLKFTRNGNVWVSLETLKSRNGTCSIRFSVKDDGPGIPLKQQKRIFDNFSQLERKHNNDYQGTGLGLSIVKNLVELLGSEINLKSKVDEGAVFSFDLDFKIDTETSKLQEKQKSELEKIAENNFTILIVEDNKVNQIVTQNILEKENYKTHIVNNGELAIQEVMKNSYDLVLMDLNMPVMGGIEATTKIRAFNEHIPILALTAADLDEVEDKVMRHGFNDIIIKPYDNFEFFQTITKHLSKPETTSKLNVV
ncbi:ATP-binding response regulator [Lacinutrix salivirga]